MILLERKGYQSLQKKFSLEEGKTFAFDARLTLRQGTLTLQGPQGASVEIEGKNEVPYSATKTLPLTEQALPIGTYTLRVSQKGYFPEQKSITISEGRQTALAIELTAQPPRLKIRISREDLIETSDGKFMVTLKGKKSYSQTQAAEGNAAFEITVEPGSYQLSVAHSSGKYEAQERAVILERGQIAEEAFELKLTQVYQTHQAWKWKRGSALAATLVSVGLGYSAFTAMEAAIVEKEALDQKIQNAQTLKDSYQYQQQSDKKMEEAKSYQQQSQNYLLLSVGMAALTGWIWWDEPPLACPKHRLAMASPTARTSPTHLLPAMVKSFTFSS
ncbi:PEGA domain-containing protein [Deltaproteobacteria bacterium TL4]